MKYQVGQEVWMATFERVEEFKTCPDCGGTGRARIVFHDDSIVSVECGRCSAGYNEPTGKVKEYGYLADAVKVTITGFEVRPGEDPRYYTTPNRIVDEDKLFLDREEALAHAKSLNKDHNKREEDDIHVKFNQHKTWSWNASYHKKQVKEHERQAEYHRRKLNAANLHTRETK